MARKTLELSQVLKYGNPGEVPAYSIEEAAHYFIMPTATVRAWVCGMGAFKPVIALPAKGVNLLSFLNLAEAHVLRALRHKHRIKLPMIRKALRFVTLAADYGCSRIDIEEGGRCELRLQAAA